MCIFSFNNKILFKYKIFLKNVRIQYLFDFDSNFTYSRTVYNLFLMHYSVMVDFFVINFLDIFFEKKSILNRPEDVTLKK